MTARLVIARHGNTFETGDVVTRVGGRTDLPLSPSGREQADALGKHFSGTTFATARSGPLKRTRETARAILGTTEEPELLTELFLREIDYGPDENQPEDRVIARIGKQALEAWEAHSTVPPGWRVDPAALVGNWQQLFAELRGEAGSHLIVTSNGIARFALAAAGDTRAGKLRTGAYGVIVLDGDAVAVESWDVRP
jgi:probable phosphoglycerate mutase